MLRVHNGKISRVSQSLLELISRALFSICTYREDTKEFSASHFTHLPDELKVQVDVQAHRLICMFVYVPQKIMELKAIKAMNTNTLGEILNKKFDFIIQRLAVLSFQSHMNCLHFFWTKILSYNKRKVHLTNRICTRNSHSYLS